MSIYADSSVLVSLYLRNQHSALAQRMLPRHADIWLTPLHRVEWAHALALQVFLRRISAAEAHEFQGNFERDRQSRFWIEVDLPERVFERCIQLAHQQSGRMGMATLDSLHVASALELGAERFWTFDERQAKLARAVGMKAGPRTSLMPPAAARRAR